MNVLYLNAAFYKCARWQQVDAVPEQSMTIQAFWEGMGVRVPWKSKKRCEAEL